MISNTISQQFNLFNVKKNISAIVYAKLQTKKTTKGQSISKWPFDVFDHNTNEIFLMISALASQKRSNQKVPNQIFF